MAAITEEEVIKVDRWNSVKLYEAESKVSITAVNNRLNGNFALRYAFPQKSEWVNGKPVPEETSRPVSILLGETKENARGTLQELIRMLG